MNLINDVRDGLSRLDHSHRELKKFGFTIAFILFLLSVLVFFGGSLPRRSFYMAGVASAFLLAAFFFPYLLKPVRIGWMGLAFVLGYFMSRLLLAVIFYLVITPIGVIFRLFGKDILHKKIRKNRESYWIKRSPENKNAKDYEKLY